MLETMFHESFSGWLSIAGILLIIELLTGTMYMLWLALAAAINSIIFLFLKDTSIEVQVFSFAIIAAITILIGRKYFPTKSKNFSGDDINNPEERLLNKIVIANEDFVGGIGSVNQGDTIWRALCESHNPVKGDSLKIIKIDGATLYVEKQA